MSLRKSMIVEVTVRPKDGSSDPEPVSAVTTLAVGEPLEAAKTAAKICADFVVRAAFSSQETEIPS